MLFLAIKIDSNLTIVKGTRGKNFFLSSCLETYAANAKDFFFLDAGRHKD